MAGCFRGVCFHLEMKTARKNTQKLARDKICALMPGVNSHVETRKNFSRPFVVFCGGMETPCRDFARLKIWAKGVSEGQNFRNFSGARRRRCLRARRRGSPPRRSPKPSAAARPDGVLPPVVGWQEQAGWLKEKSDRRKAIVKTPRRKIATGSEEPGQKRNLV